MENQELPLVDVMKSLSMARAELVKSPMALLSALTRQGETIASLAPTLVNALKEIDKAYLLVEEVVVKERKEREKKEKKHHFFCASVCNWTAGDDLLQCLLTQKKRDAHAVFKVKEVFVFRVPVSSAAEYEIRNYQPQVEGAELLTTVRY